MAKERNHDITNEYTTHSLLDRLIDGRVVDISEMADRQLLLQQLSLFCGIPKKQAPKRVR